MKFMMIIIVFFGIFLLAGGPSFAIVGASSDSLFLLEPDPTPKSPEKCYYEKSYSMKNVVCDRLSLKEIPDLHSDIEILHFSLNRLGELTNDTLKKYPDLGYVIIRENAISDIDTGAFTAQEDTLKGVDLTDNKLLSFPINTLAYPNFIRLYLGKNYLNDDALNYSIESGLEILELFDNKLTKLPSKLLLPDLTYLNVSKNKIIKIKTEQLARFCSLKVLDISKNPLRMSTCECHGLKKWINMRNITVIPVNIKCGKCPSFDDDLFMLNDTFKVYDKCIEKKLSRKNSMMKFNAMKFVSSWKFIVLFIVGIVMITIAVYCTCKKRNKKEGNLKINGKLVFAKNGSIKNQSDEAIDSSMKSSNDEFVTRL